MAAGVVPVRTGLVIALLALLTACGSSSQGGDGLPGGDDHKADDNMDGGPAKPPVVTEVTVKPSNLPGQGWSAQEQETMHHLWTGARLVPIAWLEALVDPVTGLPFTSAAVSRRFGLIPDPDYYNLPVGIAESDRTYYTQYYYGQSCTTCHTTEIHYKGQTLRIEGGGAMGDFFGWVQAIGQALEYARDGSDTFSDFAHGVYPDPLEFYASYIALGIAVDQYIELMEPFRDDGAYADLHPVKEGFGRADAVGRSFLGQAYFLDPNALQPVDAPVSVPPLWGTNEHDYTHYTGSEPSAFARNVTQTLGSLADFDVDTGRSDVQFDNLRTIHDTISKLEAPAWPEAVLGNIDKAKAERGLKLWNAQCATCHEGDRVGPELKVTFVDVDDVGTDPKAADNLNNARIDGSMVGLGPSARPLEISEVVTDRVIQYFFDEEGLTPAEEETYTNGRPDTPVARRVYKAGPLDGVWATAPYLHNGSVASLHELLLPAAQRSVTFKIAPDAEFDPKDVGYVKNPTGSNTFEFDTTLVGNWNTGHEYGTTLTDAERYDLIEYLKTR